MGDFSDTLNLIESCLPKDQDGNFKQDGEKSDVVHDVLAFLAEEMIEMNKEKQQIVNNFHSWLEKFIEVDIKTLSGKTKLQKFDDFDWSFVLQVLLNNNSKLGINMTLDEPKRIIHEKFTDAMKQLKPLKLRIAKTDDLIDSIVYKLYGLTDEEIRIVEESVGDK